MKTFRVPVVCSLTIISAFLPCVALAAPGDLDPTFATGGMLSVGFGGTSDNAYSSLLQADGKLVMLGTSGSQLTLVRLNTDGSPDPTFGSAGKAVFAPSEMPYQSPKFVKLQVDGKIVVASDSSSSGSYVTVISRFNTNGTLDTSFASPNGYTTRTYGYQYQTCVAMSLLGDGRIAFAGTYQVPGGQFGEPRYFVTRILGDGNYDPILVGGGFTSTNYSQINDMIVQSDNKFLVVGYDNGNGVMRFNEDGSRDSGFGSGGRLVIAASSSIRSVAIQQGDFTVSNPDRIVVAGSGYIAPSNAVLIARLSLGGVLDSSFGGGVGYVNCYVGPNPNVVKVLDLSSGFSTRTIYVIGVNYPAGIAKIFLAKFNSAGTLDATYGGGVGVVSTSTGPNQENIYDASSVSGGRLLLTCASNPDPNQDSDYTVVRYTTSTGLLDANFGTGGILEYNVGDLEASPTAVAMQSDGKILIGGNANGVLGLMRLNGDGTYDTNFASKGKLLFSAGSTPQANALTLLPGGKFLLGGSANIDGKDNVLLARFLSNGVPDATFGTNGVVTTAVGTNSAFAKTLRILSDGKILVGGGSVLSANNAYLVMRYLSNGVLDTSWNGTGANVTGVGSSGDTLAGVTVLPDGKIAAGGASSFGSASAKFSMTRYLTNGTLDNSFGTFGRLAFNVGPANLDAATGFFSQPDGKLLMEGYALNAAATDADIAVARLNTDGSFDSGFNGTGKLVASIGLGIDFGACGAVRNDNKIVIGAVTTIGSTYHFGILRLTSEGQPDSSFGFGGRNYYDFGTEANETPAAMAIDAAGRVVMVGSVNHIFGIIRVIGDNYTVQFTWIQRMTNGHMLLKGIGIPSSAHSLLQSPVLSGAAFTPMDTVNTDDTGNWQYEDTTAGVAANRFYRISYP